MPSFSSLTAIAALASVALATPVDMSNLEKRTSFRLEQVHRGFYQKSGPKQMLKTYQKYGAQAPSDVQSAAAATTTGTVDASPEDAQDSLYLCPVEIGGNTLQLDFDTGSADLWVFSSQMASSEQTGHDVYEPGDSAQELSGASWDISYGDGSGASGVVYADTVVVGGVTATSQAVEAATSVSRSFTQDVDDDGLLGLAFSTINTVTPRPQKTFFDTVKGQLAKALFAVTLKKGEAGTYDFGFIDDSKYEGEIVYTDVNTENGFWEFTPSGYVVGADGETVEQSITAIADTGTTLLYLPEEVVEAYYDQVEGAQYNSLQGGYVFPCSAELPDFSLIIGGETRTVPGSYIKYAPVSLGQCFGGMQPNSGIAFSIVGDTFLKAMYVVFDQSTEQPRLGWAQQKTSDYYSS